MERLDCQQSMDAIFTEYRTAELENSLGVFRGRSVETLPEGGEVTHRAALARPLPHDCIELAKGTQENEPQYPDARSSTYTLTDDIGEL